MKTYINSQEQHNKFWEYEISGAKNNVVTCRWGRVGSTTQSKTFNFSSTYEANYFIEGKIREKEKKGYAEVTKEKLQEESETSRLLGVQNKISKMEWVSKRGKTLNKLLNYDPEEYVYVEILNSWKKTITRLLLSKNESFKIEGNISEFDRKFQFDRDLVPINGDRDFVNAVRMILRKMSEVIAEIMKTVKIGAVGVRNLFDDDDNNYAPEIKRAFKNIDTTGFDTSVVMSFVSMGVRSLDL